MLGINSYLHRHELSDIIERWMYGDVQPGDAGRITHLIHFNHIYLCRYLKGLSRDLFGRLHGSDVITRKIAQKGALKDALIASPPYRTPRIDQLLETYQRNPGEFYRETPFHGVLAFCRREGNLDLAGSYRIKRARRLAEKMARRIIGNIFEVIKGHADVLAEERAATLGILRHHLVTPQEEMIEEFHRAEKRLLEDLRQRRPILAFTDVAINDVAGIKVIWEGPSLEGLREALGGAGCRIVEEETHRGLYKATNLIVRYEPAREAILQDPLPGPILSDFKRKGWAPAACQRDFQEFVATGEGDVLLEVIASGYEETLESEIGCSMHEDRILAQRREQPYRGHLAENIEYLLEYLFTLPDAPERVPDTLPIRLWDRYLPDYFFEVMKALFRLPSPGPFPEKDPGDRLR